MAYRLQYKNENASPESRRGLVYIGLSRMSAKMLISKKMHGFISWRESWDNKCLLPVLEFFMEKLTRMHACSAIVALGCDVFSLICACVCLASSSRVTWRLSTSREHKHATNTRKVSAWICAYSLRAHSNRHQDESWCLKASQKVLVPCGPHDPSLPRNQENVTAMFRTNTALRETWKQSIIRAWHWLYLQKCMRVTNR